MEWVDSFLLASMGPLTFISGNHRQQADVDRRRRRFNGATDFHQWKLYERNGNSEHLLALMGPLTFISGNCEVCDHAV